MEAKITLTMTPAEFDLLRESVEQQRSNENEIVNDRSTDSSLRAKARERVARLHDLLTKLK